MLTAQKLLRNMRQSKLAEFTLSYKLVCASIPRSQYCSSGGWQKLADGKLIARNQRPIPAGGTCSIRRLRLYDDSLTALRRCTSHWETFVLLSWSCMYANRHKYKCRLIRILQSFGNLQLQTVPTSLLEFRPKIKYAIQKQGHIIRIDIM